MCDVNMHLLCSCGGSKFIYFNGIHCLVNWGILLLHGLIDVLMSITNIFKFQLLQDNKKHFSAQCGIKGLTALRLV